MYTNFLKKQLKHLIITALMISLFGLSLIYNNSKDQEYKKKSKSIDGETLFTGIFFGNKIVGSIFPEFNPPESILENSERKKLVEFTISHAKANNVAFFDEFKRGIESGDPVEVEASMSKASAIVQNTIEILRKDEDGVGSKINLLGAVVNVMPVGVSSSGMIVYPEILVHPGTIIIPGPPLTITATATSDIIAPGSFSSQAESLSREKYISYLTKAFSI